MRELKDTVDAAIRASGKTAGEIAKNLGVDPNTISRIRTGDVVNPGVQLVKGIAKETGTTVGALVDDESFAVSPDDERELLRFRDWIDSKLTTIDALSEPNAEIIDTRRAVTRDWRIADRPLQRVDPPFGPDARLVLRAIGTSMTDDGILPDDTLYATPAETTQPWPVGRVVAARSAHGVFVKRLVAEHGRHFLLSAHPRYRPIAVDESFELLGIVIGRVGQLG